MKTRKTILGLCLSVLSLFTQAQNGLEKIFVERYYVADAIDAANSNPAIPVGAVTYRIYADMLPGYKVQTIYAEQSVSGGPAHPMTMTTTTYFWNQEDYGAPIPTFSSTNAKKNTVMLDSWLSTGGACNGFNGVPKTEDNGLNNFVNSNVPQLLQNNAAQAGIPLTTQDGMLAGTVPTTGTLGIDPAMLDLFGDGSANGNTFLVTDGSWYCLAGAPGIIPASNKVLIAQITTDGIFHFELNIQIGTPSGGTEKYVHSNPTGVERTIPSLIQTLYPVPAAPSISITAPANNSTFSIGTPVVIEADATDEGFIAQVEFFVDGISIGIDESAPYTADYTGLVAASHVITAKATDNEGLFTTSLPVNFTVEAPVSNSIDVTVYLEGPYTGSSMSTSLNPALIPLTQPYNVAPWNYAGTESVASIPTGVVDWVLVDLRDAATPETALPGTALAGWPKAFFLKSDGSVVALDGTSMPDIGNPTVTNNLYVLIRHRNHIAVMSASGMTLAGSSYGYDFSTALSQAYNGAAGYKDIATGVFGMVAGDADADGEISVLDFSVWATDFGSNPIYFPSDIDGDGDVSVLDFSKWATNFGTGNPIEGKLQKGKYHAQVPENN